MDNSIIEQLLEKIKQKKLNKEQLTLKNLDKIEDNATLNLIKQEVVKGTNLTPDFDEPKVSLDYSQVEVDPLYKIKTYIEDLAGGKKSLSDIPLDDKLLDPIKSAKLKDVLSASVNPFKMVSDKVNDLITKAQEMVVSRNPQLVAENIVSSAISPITGTLSKLDDIQQELSKVSSDFVKQGGVEATTEPVKQFTKSIYENVLKPIQQVSTQDVGTSFKTATEPIKLTSKEIYERFLDPLADVSSKIAQSPELQAGLQPLAQAYKTVGSAITEPAVNISQSDSAQAATEPFKVIGDISNAMVEFGFENPELVGILTAMAISAPIAPSVSAGIGVTAGAQYIADSLGFGQEMSDLMLILSYMGAVNAPAISSTIQALHNRYGKPVTVTINSEAVNKIVSKYGGKLSQAQQKFMKAFLSGYEQYGIKSPFGYTKTGETVNIVSALKQPKALPTINPELRLNVRINSLQDIQTIFRNYRPTEPITPKNIDVFIKKIDPVYGTQAQRFLFQELGLPKKVLQEFMSSNIMLKNYGKIREIITYDLISNSNMEYTRSAIEKLYDAWTKGKNISLRSIKSDAVLSRHKIKNIQELKQHKYYELYPQDAEKLSIKDLKEVIGDKEFENAVYQLSILKVPPTKKEILKQAIKNKLYLETLFEDVQNKGVIDDFEKVPRDVYMEHKIMPCEPQAQAIVDKSAKTFDSIMKSYNIKENRDLHRKNVSNLIALEYLSKADSSKTSFTEWALPKDKNLVKSIADKYFKKIKGMSPEELIEYSHQTQIRINELSEVFGNYRIHPRIEKILNKYLSFKGDLPKQYYALVQDYVGKINSAMYETKVVYNALHKAISKSNIPPEQVAKALKGEIDISVLPEDLAQVVSVARNSLDTYSNQLLKYRFGKDKFYDVVEKNLGKWMVNVYKTHLPKVKWVPDDATIKKYLNEVFAKKHPKIYAKYNEKVWVNEIKTWFNTKDVNYYENKHKFTLKESWFASRKTMSEIEKDLLGHISDKPELQYVMSAIKVSQMATNAEFLSKIAELDFVFDMPPSPEGFVKIPDSDTWGKLKNKYVPEEVYAHLSELMTNNKAISSFFTKYMVVPFNMGKTIFNVPTHARNTIGNFSFAMLDGIFSPKALQVLPKTLHTLLTEGKLESVSMWKELYEMGIVGTEYTKTDLMRGLKGFESILKELSTGEITKEFDTIKLLKKSINIPIKVASKLYELEDQFFKVLSYLYHRQVEGFDKITASSKVKLHYQDYSQSTGLMKELMKSDLGKFFSPFLRFYEQSFRIAYNHILESYYKTKGWSDEYICWKLTGRKPERIPLPDKPNYKHLINTLFVLIGLPLLIERASKVLYDVSDQDEENIRKLLPEYMENTHIIFYKNKRGALKAFNYGYLIPFDNLRITAEGIVSGDLEKIADSVGFMSHPVIAILSMIRNGTNRYNYKIINEYGDTLTDKASAISSEILSYMLPDSLPLPVIEDLKNGILTPSPYSGRAIKPLLDAIYQQQFPEKAKVDKYGRRRDVNEELKNFFTGLKTYNLYPSILFHQKITGLERSKQLAKTEYENWLKSNPTASIFRKNAEKEKYLKRIETITKIIKDTVEAKNKLNSRGLFSTVLDY